jgi:serine/threonine-protein kinase
MSRNAYLGFMLVGVVVIPLLIVVPQRLVRTISPRLINVPNRDYWLAPERIESTLDYLRNHAVWFAALLGAFMCFVHWEVVQANMRRPVRLVAEPFFVGIAVYVASVLVWIGAMVVHFRRIPDREH